MAMQADPPTKLAGHNRDLESAIAAERVFHVGELFVTAEYPSADGRTIFYAESASLVSFLVVQRAPTDFVQFMHIANKRGYDFALSEVYGIDSVARLERLWRSKGELVLERPVAKPPG
jgi:hypothetical protein